MKRIPTILIAAALAAAWFCLLLPVQHLLRGDLAQGETFAPFAARVTGRLAEAPELTLCAWPGMFDFGLWLYLDRDPPWCPCAPNAARAPGEPDRHLVLMWTSQRDEIAPALEDTVTELERSDPGRHGRGGVLLLEVHHAGPPQSDP